MARCDSYYAGECTQGACQAASWVGDGWGNATDWCGHAAGAGLQLTSVPTKGAVVVYAAGDGYSQYGHCGVVQDVYADGSFLVLEMNYSTWNDYDQRVSSQYDVECFILPPGASPGGPSPTPPGRGGPGQANIINEWWQLQDAINRQGWDALNFLPLIAQWAREIG